MIDGTSAARRDGETTPIPIRSSRFFKENDSWFFATREGALMGPFDSQDEARIGLDDFLEFISLANIDTLMSFEKSMTKVKGNRITFH